MLAKMFFRAELKFLADFADYPASNDAANSSARTARTTKTLPA
jgi:hypothetical protein